MKGRWSPHRRDFLRRVGGACLALAGGALLRPAMAHADVSPATRMMTGEPSATALSAALMRAVHQVIDYPRVLDYPLAVTILGTERANTLQPAVDAQSRSLRALIAMRSRYAEDRLRSAVERGVRQLAQKMQAIVFRETQLLTPQEANRAYFGQRIDGLRIAGSAHMMSARL